MKQTHTIIHSTYMYAPRCTPYVSQTSVQHNILDKIKIIMK